MQLQSKAKIYIYGTDIQNGKPITQTQYSDLTALARVFINWEHTWDNLTGKNPIDTVLTAAQVWPPPKLEAWWCYQQDMRISSGVDDPYSFKRSLVKCDNTRPGGLTPNEIRAGGAKGSRLGLCPPAGAGLSPGATLPPGMWWSGTPGVADDEAKAQCSLGDGTLSGGDGGICSTARKDQWCVTCLTPSSTNSKGNQDCQVACALAVGPRNINNPVKGQATGGTMRGAANLMGGHGRGGIGNPQWAKSKKHEDGVYQATIEANVNGKTIGKQGGPRGSASGGGCQTSISSEEGGYCACMPHCAGTNAAHFPEDDGDCAMINWQENLKMNGAFVGIYPGGKLTP